MHSCGISKVHINIDDPGLFLSRMREISDRWNTHIIFFDAGRMAGTSHVESALFHAFRSLKEGTMISSRVEMEALLYASGSRQIVHGMTFGVHPGENCAYLCLCPDVPEAMEVILNYTSTAEDEDWESITDAKCASLCSLFSITPEELAIVGPERIQDLVLERVALLQVYR